MTLATHSGLLERWLGIEQVEQLSSAMRDWYGPPIPVSGVPGNVWAHKGGDFRGSIRGGHFASYLDYAESISQRFCRLIRRMSRKTVLHTGFSTLADLISEGNNGKIWVFPFNKTSSNAAAGFSSSFWRVATFPAAGATPGNAAGGTAFTSSSAYNQPNPISGDTLHFVRGYPFTSSSGTAGTLLLYDLLFGVNKTMSNSGTEAVTGIPTRYQSQTATDQDYVGGNFLFVQVGGTGLSATAHNWTTCLYTDQGGSSSTLPSLTGISGAGTDRLDHPTNQWFAPLEAGDVGIKALTQMQCSSNVLTGEIWFMIGHPIAWMPCPINGVTSVADGIQSAFQPTRIFDNACLSFLNVTHTGTGGNIWAGYFTAVAG